MPFYEYQCTECGKLTEILQKMSDPPVSSCGSCAGKMKKLISQSTFHLKGSGWYVTDYADNSSSSNAKSTNTSDDSSKKDTKKSVEKSKKVSETPKKEASSFTKKGEAKK
ncbi:MAG: zinc ribbon domain-containing protein [Deltaproteobacteria bacterium]|nr:zinc ribbon domain-containing protein [Deltaproteobacteria bacterium]MBW1915400.1 zinc ribbon domain-containing protein [Deltaproteobacteria bacterium]